MYNEFGEGFLSHSEGYKEFYGLKWWLFMSQVDSDPIFFNIIFSLVDNGIKGVTQPPGWKIPYTVQGQQENALIKSSEMSPHLMCL